MNITDYVEEIKLELTGNLLHLEIPDDTLAKVVNKAFREVQRFIDSSALITVPFSPCIDLKDSQVSTVVNVYRTELGADSNVPMYVDPLWAQQIQLLSGMGGDVYNLNYWMKNYAAWCTSLQIRNTISTDLAFRYDKTGQKLYINIAYNRPAYITIEYIPFYHNIEEVTSDYWIDIILRLSVALTKVILGRIRSRYTQTNALWTQDGETLLAEGNEELNTLRETLRVNSQMIYPID